MVEGCGGTDDKRWYPEGSAELAQDRDVATFRALRRQPLCRSLESHIVKDTSRDRCPRAAALRSEGSYQ